MFISAQHFGDFWSWSIVSIGFGLSAKQNAVRKRVVFSTRPGVNEKGRDIFPCK